MSEASSSSSVVSYTSVFPFEARLIKSQDAVNALYHVGRNHLTGSDAEFEYCRVELWDQKVSSSAPVANTFAARKLPGIRRTERSIWREETEHEWKSQCSR